MGRRDHGTLVNVQGLDVEAATDKVVEAFRRMGLEVEDDISKHEGPGPHKTGTPQEAHAGDGGKKLTVVQRGALVVPTSEMSGWPKVAPIEERESLLQRIIDKIDPSRTERSEMGAQGIKILHTPDGETVLRRIDSEDMLGFISNPATREHAAYLVAKDLDVVDLLGAQKYEAEYYEEWDINDGATWQEFFKNAQTGNRSSKAYEARRTDAANVVNVYDYIINNQDRHGGNWMVDNDDGSLRLIDHGLVLDRGPAGNQLFATTGREAEYVDPARVYPLLDNSDLAGFFGMSRMGAEYEAMMERAEQYREEGSAALSWPRRRR